MLRRLADGHHVRRHVACHRGVVRDEGVRADLAELVHAGVAAHDDPVAELDVTAEHHDVGEHAVVADHAVVRDVRVRHEQVVVADARHAVVLRRAAIERHALAERRCGRRSRAASARRDISCPAAHRRPTRTGTRCCRRRSRVGPCTTTCGPMPRARTDLDARADHRIGPDLHVVSEHRLWRRRPPSDGSTLSSIVHSAATLACGAQPGITMHLGAAGLLPVDRRAMVANFQIVRMRVRAWP